MTFCFLSCWRQKLPGCPPRASWGGTAPSVTQLRNRTAMPEPARRSACRKTRRPHSRGRCARQRPRASLTMSDRADEEDRTAFPRRSLPFSSARASLWAGLGAPGAVPSPGRPGLRVALPSCSLQWPGLSRIPRCGGSGPASHARAKPAARSLCAPPPRARGPATVPTVGGAQTDGGRSSDALLPPLGVLFTTSFRSPKRSRAAKAQRTVNQWAAEQGLAFAPLSSPSEHFPGKPTVPERGADARGNTPPGCPTADPASEPGRSDRPGSHSPCKETAHLCSIINGLKT